MLVLSNNYTNPENNDFEVVERKGVGHPDTLADALAEELSRVYSKYCYDTFGAVLHHNLDKLYIGAGWTKNSFGSVEKIKPIKVLVNGRISNTFGRKKIDIEALFRPIIKEYIGCVLPHLDVETDLDIIINPTQHSRIPYWFSPRSLVDVPDATKVMASDTSVVTSFYPYSTCEKLALELEHFFWNENEKGYPVPKFKEIGQDIKVMVTRIKEDISVVVCLPVISTEITSREEYFDVVERFECELNQIAKEICSNSKYSVNVFIYRDNSFRGTPYMLSLGTCAECGEEGLVGRGNNSLGFIPTFRPHSMEAPAGKNPRYHTGRVLSFLGNRLAKAIYDETGVRNQILLLTKNTFSLVPPYVINIDLESAVPENVIEGIVERELNTVNYTVEILQHRNLV